MFRTPTKEREVELDGQKGGPSPTRPSNVRMSIDRIEEAAAARTIPNGRAAAKTATKTSPQSKNPNSLEMRGCSSKPPTKMTQQTIKSDTVTKGKRSQPTPSPIKTTIEAKSIYPNRAAEATAVHKKGLENLNRSLNLRKDVKQEVKKALDRLYELTKMAPATRKLNEELEREDTYKKNLVDTPTLVNLTENIKEYDSKNQEIKKHEDQLILKIEENNRLLVKNGKKMEEIKTMIKLQKETIEQATYANIAAAVPKPKQIPERTALHSVVITSRDEQDTGEEVLEMVRKAVDAKEGWIKVEKVRKAKDRKIVVGCGTKEDRQKIKERLERARERLVVEEVKNRDPLLVLKDVLSRHTDEEVVRALRNQNREVFHGLDNEDDRISIKYKKKARNPHTNHVVLVISPTIWRRALDAGKLRVDLQKVHVEDQSPLVQCSRCLGYGHGRRFCKEPEDLCSHCGGPHLGMACPERVLGETPECVNCKRANFESCKHNAFSKECPVRRKWDAIARAAVSYC